MPILEPILQNLRINQVISHIDPGSVVVDIGCDSPPILLKKIAPNMKYCIGIDEVIAYKKSGNIETFSQKIVKELKIESTTADIITMLAVLEHLKHPQDIIAECFRILKPGGKLLITVPSPKSKNILEFFSVLGLVRKEMIDQHENYFTKANLAKIIESAGFSQISIKYFELGFNTFATAVK